MIKTNIKKKITSNKTKHIEADKKLTNLTKKLHKYQKKNMIFLLGRMYFTSNDDYQNFLAFATMLSSLILDSNRKVTDWILTGISSEKIKPFDNGLEPTMSNLANGRVNLQFNNSFLVQKMFLHCIVTLS